ncbi:hypothetical protein FB446DRAFT_709415 [Lentinula raphanica]|nr:hypothetical protein FB446DRAFT_709415 [Lentinula raphanica]
MKRRAFLESQKTMNSVERDIPPKCPRLVMTGEVVSATERAANIRELVLHTDEIATTGSPSSIHSHMDGPLAEDVIPDLPDVGPIDETLPESQQRSKKTQTGETLDQFIPELPWLLSLILLGEAPEDIGSLCSCNRGSRIMQCHDCFKYETSCEECFIQRHHAIPFHWPKEHHLASKKAAYDYIGALRRLSDGAFTSEVPDPFSQFMMAVRIWRQLCLEKWTGQAHDLSSSFPHRTPGSLVLFCPACPEDSYNMEIGWERTPAHLKHLNQEQLELDGNFHLQQLEKKKYSDPNDISLETANGIGYFPDEDRYQKYQNLAPDNSEKLTCSYLNVVNNQNKSKFKNMKTTGVVNVVCSHSIIRSSVNLAKGEAHKYSDFALAHAHSHTRNGREPSHLGVCDRMLSYDCNCHFYGENIEATWVESNQLGPAIRQMNHGNHIGTITLNYTYWNWLKITRMHLSLYKAYKEAHELYQDKRQAFLSLSVLYSQRTPKWIEFAQTAPCLANGIIQGIYEHTETQGNCIECTFLTVNDRLTDVNYG